MVRLIVLLFVLMMVACTGVDAAPAARADAIVCTAAYRSSVAAPLEREETVSFGDSDAEQSLAFTDLVFHAAYTTGELDNERALRTWVTATDETVIYNIQLYQLPLDKGPDNQFVGGHGFTGLNYTYHPMSLAELQFWCEAQ
jgi:hypothetical protein